MKKFFTGIVTAVIAAFLLGSLAALVMLAVTSLLTPVERILQKTLPVTTIFIIGSVVLFGIFTVIAVVRYKKLTDLGRKARTVRPPHTQPPVEAGK